MSAAEKYTLEFAAESAGWVAEVAEVPGVQARGATREEAGAAALAMLFRALEEQDDSEDVATILARRGQPSEPLDAVIAELE
jgi:predicted RNase H-like HicB family nuclease